MRSLFNDFINLGMVLVLEVKLNRNMNNIVIIAYVMRKSVTTVVITAINFCTTNVEFQVPAFVDMFYSGEKTHEKALPETKTEKRKKTSFLKKTQETIKKKCFGNCC